MSVDAVEETDAKAKLGPFVAGERGLPIEERARRRGPGMQTLMAAGLVATVAAAMLGWWFSRGESSAAEAVAADRAARSRQAANAEMKLPPLAKPYPLAVAPVATATVQEDEGDLVDAEMVDFVPEDEAALFGLPRLPGTYEMGSSYPLQVTDSYGGAALPLDPRLSSPVLWRASVGGAGMDTIEGVGEPDASRSAAAAVVPGRARQWAERLPGRSRLLARGTIVDCTLETAIDSQLAGLATAVVSRDVWSADGSNVVLARGTRLIGVTRSETRAGQSRVWVLWEEARTPSGLLVPLASPATDALGRTGIAGVVDTHFDERFGAAILLSVIDAAAQALASSARGDGDTVVVDSGGTSEIATEVLRSTVGIPPTIRVAQGTRVQALVAQDVDFASVMPPAP